MSLFRRFLFGDDRKPLFELVLYRHYVPGSAYTTTLRISGTAAISNGDTLLGNSSGTSALVTADLANVTGTYPSGYTADLTVFVASGQKFTLNEQIKNGSTTVGKAPYYEIYGDPETFYRCIRNWKEFYPTIAENEKYRTRMPAFSLEQMILVKGAKDFCDQEYDKRGTLSRNYVQLNILDESTGTYGDYLEGRIDFTDRNKKLFETHVALEPTSLVTRAINRDDTELELTTLVDMDGNALPSFAEADGVTEELLGYDANLGFQGLEPIGVTVLEDKYLQIGFDDVDLNTLGFPTVPPAFKDTAGEVVAQISGVEGTLEDAVLNYNFDYYFSAEKEGGGDFTYDITVRARLVRTIVYADATPDDVEIIMEHTYTEASTSEVFIFDQNFTGTFTEDLTLSSGDTVKYYISLEITSQNLNGNTVLPIYHIFTDTFNLDITWTGTVTNPLFENGDTYELSLDGITLDRKFVGESSDIAAASINDEVGADLYFQLGTENMIINEVPEEFFTTPNAWGPTEAALSHFAALKDQGDSYKVTLDFDVRIQGSTTDFSTGTFRLRIFYELQRYDYATATWETFFLDSYEVTDDLTIDYDIVHAGNTSITFTGAVNPADEDDYDVLRAVIHLKFDNGTGDYLTDATVTVNKHNITIEKKATYATTTHQGMLSWEFGLRMLQKITGRLDPLRSSYLGRPDGAVKKYASDGAGALIFWCNGWQVRGFPLDEYPVKSAFYDWFRSINADGNLGMGLITENGIQYLAIEKIEYFWNKDNVASFTIIEPADSEEETALEYIFSHLKFGNTRYERQTNGTLESPHAKREYVTGLDEVLKNEYNFEDPGVSSAHLWEIVRQDVLSEDSKKDGTYDGDLFKLQVKRDGDYTFVPVTGADYDTVNNIDNPLTQLNLGLTPRQAMERHLNWILGGGYLKFLTDNPTDIPVFRFQSGEGNLALVTKRTSGSKQFAESENVGYNVTEVDGVTLIKPLFIADKDNFSYPLTKAQINELLADPNLVIPVQRGSVTEYRFIQRIEITDTEKRLAEFKTLKVYNG